MVKPPATGDFFEVAGWRKPPGSTPIVDDEQHVVIGYMGPFIGGIARVYDLEGNEATIVEKPLETPLLDPLDVILIFGALGRAALRGLFRLGLDAAGETTAASAIATASRRFGPMLRLMFRSSVSGDLRFAAKPLARMSEPGRFVPVSILKLAIRYGVRDADPQGAAGVYRYSIQMFRASKNFSRAGEGLYAARHSARSR